MDQNNTAADKLCFDKARDDFKDWASGFGVIKHQVSTQDRVLLTLQECNIDLAHALPILKAADRLCSQAMWLVVHMTYAENIKLGGEALSASDFKQSPQGHTGGALNMVPAYIGYLAANALSGDSREWLMGQGHCVAAIDAVNLLLGNSLSVHEDRYPLTDEGLSRLSRDFYSYAINAQGRPASPVGSHVNVNTAGASIEGGYLGFAGLHYVHQPLPGEKLVAFLSDGAFEEQRGSDWSARWWRAEDSGLVAPILIANGRRIDQRTTAQQLGGVDYFMKHLRAHNFEPNVFDGRDPAAFAVNILHQEFLLEFAANELKSGRAKYPVRLPYGIAETEKGFGFYGAGTNPAHGTPLPDNPRVDAHSRALFNACAAKLFVTEEEWQSSAEALNNHLETGRQKERDVYRNIAPIDVSVPELATPEAVGESSPMACLDEAFVGIVQANPDLRPRVGNPDELSSNRFNLTLALLKHRVTEPEAGVSESVHGAVITALNEEAVISAVLANRRGINVAISYEAFAPKMLGALRQKIIFTRHYKEKGNRVPWLSIPVIATSHLWENGKNEQSHQDSTFCEAMLAEMSDVSRVVFPADGASAIEIMRHCYQRTGQIFTMVVPKGKVPNQLNPQQAKQLANLGAVRVAGNGDEDIQLLALGAYQLIEAKKMRDRLIEHGIAVSLVYIAEPAKFRSPRDGLEADFVNEFSELMPAASVFGAPTFRLFLCHGRPEAFLGVLRPLDLGPYHTQALGYINQGGTFDAASMLFANRCTWAHGLAALSAMVPELKCVLNSQELAAVDGVGDPYDVISRPYFGKN
jgi:phosphoketolase